MVLFTISFSVKNIKTMEPRSLLGYEALLQKRGTQVPFSSCFWKTHLKFHKNKISIYLHISCPRYFSKRWRKVQNGIKTSSQWCLISLTPWCNSSSPVLGNTIIISRSTTESRKESFFSLPLASGVPAYYIFLLEFLQQLSSLSTIIGWK